MRNLKANALLSQTFEVRCLTRRLPVAANGSQRALIGKWEEDRSGGLHNYRAFRPDGSFTITGVRNISHDGRWRTDGKMVYYRIPPDESEVFFEVLKIEKDRLTILMKGERPYVWKRVE